MAIALVMQQDKAYTAVLTYLRRESRPYSATDVHNNMHREYGKGAVQQALDALVVAGAVRQKDNGKQKVFVAVESDDPETASIGPELDERLAKLKDSVASAQSDIGTKQATATRIARHPSPSTADAKSLIERLESEVDEMTHRVELCVAEAAESKRASAKRQKVAEASSSKEDILKRKALRLTEWHTRKRIVKDFIDAILQQDGFQGSRESLHDEIGIETDESVGVQL